MTIEEQIEVMQAYASGKKIQFYNEVKEDWDDTGSPTWNWGETDYRVKPSFVYVPYKDTEEMIKDYCNRFGVECKNYEKPVIWVMHGTAQRMIISFDIDVVKMNYGKEIYEWTLKELFTECNYLDGSPVGKMVEE